MDSSQSPFRPECLRGKVALITGGGSGIGYGISRQIGLHGGKVVIMGRRETFLSKAVHQLQADGITASYYTGDVRSRESAEAAVEFTVKTYGRMDALVNGAAGNFLANAHELKLKGFKTVMEIDTIGVFNMSTAAFPALRESGEGAIINISMTLHYGATWFQAHASAAKAAIDSLTRSLALEWGSHGIRVNGIAPGPIANTPGMTKLAPGLGKPTEFTQKVPLGRLGTTSDIGMAVVFLMSSAASYVSGDTLVVDGGEWLHKDPFIPPEQVTRLSRAVEQRSRTMGPTSRL